MMSVQIQPAIYQQIKTPSGEIRDSSEGVLLQDVIQSESVRSLQGPSRAVYAAASLVCIAYAERVIPFGSSDSHFTKEIACTGGDQCAELFLFLYFRDDPNWKKQMLLFFVGSSTYD